MATRSNPATALPTEVDVMTHWRLVIDLAALALLAIALVGCGSSKPGGNAPPDYGALARQKVQAVQKMADGVNDPSGVAVLGAFDEFVNISFEPKDHPGEAKQILDIYNTKLKGKLKGEVAVQMQGQMARYQAVVGTK